MSIWEDYSPDFEEAYDRFESEVDEEPIFNEWVNKFSDWININKEYPIQPTLSQIRALAYYANEKGIENLSVQVLVPDKRFKTGFRVGYRDVKTTKLKRNPYKEHEENTGEKT